MSPLVMGGFCHWRSKAAWCRWQARRGVAELTWRQAKLCWRPGVVTWVSVLAACSGSRRLALLGNYQYSVGLRQRTVLAASTSWMTWLAADYGRLLSHARRLQCGTSSKDGASNSLACWLGGRGCVRVVQQEDDVLRARFGGFDGDHGKWSNNVLHPDGDIINGSATRSAMAGVVMPPHLVSSVRQ